MSGQPITRTADADRSLRTPLAAILLASFAVKIVFIWYLGDRLYFDNVKAVNFGFLVDRGDFSIHEHFVNSKTFVGPLLWFQVYDRFGVPGLKFVNMIAFLGLLVTVYRLGVRRFPQPAVVLGLFLFAFYAGTNRNIVAGEPDDNVAALCFGLGVLAYLDGRSRLLAGALMGAGFLFKFWIAVFCFSFGVFLVWKRRWRDAVLVTTAAAVPFAVINLIDGFTSLRSLLISERIQYQFSSWPDVGSRVVRTGMLFIVAASAWSWFRDRSDIKTLYVLPLVSYAVYVLVNRDAFTISYVMMPCLMFCTFLVADAVLAAARGGRWRSRPTLLLFCAVYLAAMTAITWRHLYRDTSVLTLVRTPQEVASMFGFPDMK